MESGEAAREKDFLSLLAEKARRQHSNVGMCFHIGNHAAQQGRMKGNSRIKKQMVFALKMRQNSIMRAREADVLFMREDNHSGELSLRKTDTSRSAF